MNALSLPFSVSIVGVYGAEHLQAAFAYKDSAEKFARQLRNFFQKEEERYGSHTFKEVIVKDEISGRLLTAFEFEAARV